MDGGAWWAAVRGVAKESDTTERLHFHFSLSCIGAGHGNPLQCTCLENSMDRGAGWATVHGITTELDTTERLSTVQYLLKICVLCCMFIMPHKDINKMKKAGSN